MTLSGKFTKLIVAAGLTLAAAVAFGYDNYVDDFAKIVKPKKGSAIAKAGCALCHVAKSEKLNAYGKDIQKAMRELKKDEMSAAVLKKVADLDSDKDGVKNGDELKDDTLPGDPKSVVVKPDDKNAPPKADDKSAPAKP